MKFANYVLRYAIPALRNVKNMHLIWNTAKYALIRAVNVQKSAV
jgi:hypothetical protein